MSATSALRGERPFLPSLNSDGPIEAHYHRGARFWRTGLPSLNSDGPIEARRSGCFRGCFRGLPSLNSDGPIEASTTAVLSGQRGLTFRR